ncbi:MAG: hypothetical protein AB7Q29_09325 [Vicinamibacterales bacterium]
MRKNILLICGTLSQTKAMLAIGGQLAEHDCYYTPFYCDGHLLEASRRGQLDFTVLAGPLRERTMACLRAAQVRVDERGEGRDYDLIVTCTDLIIQRNLAGKRIVLVQEGLTEPEGFLYWLVKHAGLPRVFANTAAFGLSDRYEVFCVASEGSGELFRQKGVRPEKMIVTGIPNFDNADAYRENAFPSRDFVLVCTSNARETFKYDDRLGFLRNADRVAGQRRVIFKLHPAENHERAIREIRSVTADPFILTDGNTEQMIANSEAVVAQYSTVAFTAALLGKEVHSYISPEHLRRVLPIQNRGMSARNIADVCRACFDSHPVRLADVRALIETRPVQPRPAANIHLIPHGSVRALVYPVASGLRHALRRTGRRTPPAPGPTLGADSSPPLSPDAPGSASAHQSAAR